ncbi:Glutamine--fructose-6-phosphate aminotransferase, isomerizing [Anaerohalosphaera lusitana]|uniref:Glutamine--fructose-6-phosphate aminotransferase [isomerizing] n=1 Tax=Anaerohalosphaera lusitana TaxID=1936003 RepID=A0A1U9NNA1_9BACT|nr:glutamine--fructose-6-phosphate transaminase (isomerizing) [Anaerohalosphaera lusitana]AQT69369.1 Glutamine--fructose-6-phosphate aminotransferase, isomerizing [Anaerohalosphaera lusitana]
MCGIVAYIGEKEAQPILLEGLKRLEYRGYDSAGVSLLVSKSFRIRKTTGRITALEAEIGKETRHESLGIGHTRWATHGKPTTANAHPHTDCSGKICLVHNGIIENYATLKKWLESKGCTFASETDTEVIANLIGYFYSSENGDGDAEREGINKFEWAVQQALRELVGTYGLAILCSDFPDMLIGAKKGSPLILGVGENEYIVASDAAAIVEHTTQAIYLSDNEIVTIKGNTFRTKTIDNITVSKKLSELEFSLGEIALEGYEHYMQKEIAEQVDALSTCMNGRIDLAGSRVVLGGLSNYLRDLARVKRIILTGCGTAWHAGLIGEYLFEQLARIPAEVEYASEFRYRNPIIEDGTIVIAISQSGETADTLAAIEQAKDRGAPVFGLVNVVGSTIARTTDAGVYLRVGPEIGVASTKAFTAQVTVLTMLAIELGRRRHLSQSDAHGLLEDMLNLPEKIAKALKLSEEIKRIAKANIDQPNWLFLGRGLNYPVGLEGALKLKEISYIHAEGLPAAEMKHGPIALISEGMPAVFVATQSSNYDKIIGNIEEVRARGGRTIVIASEGDEQIADYADHLIKVPEVREPLQPVVNVIPLQLLAYHAAVLKDYDVDKPRNLAKSVTVE